MWFERAAEAGNAKAQFQLGTALIEGRGVRSDNLQAYTWLTLSPSQGDANAQALIRELTPRLAQSDIARVRWNLAEMFRRHRGTREPDERICLVCFG
jgi:TPR repeat protein